MRTLNWSVNSIKELPEEIGDLIHLRHIDLCDNIGLEILPDSICDLYNLYTLRLKRCYALRKHPNNMGKLISLKHLYVEGCAALDYLPKGLGRLASLLTLDEFSGDNEKAFQFADLRTLNLEGRLTVTFPGDVEDVSEVEKAQLWDKKQLFHLGLISRVEDNMQRKSTAADILRPHEDLESLYIFGHIGTLWPNWKASLHNLRILPLSAWDECELLLPLGKLLSLERLTLQRMERAKKVGAEFLGIQDQTSLKSSSSLFPKLKELSFYEMSEWEEWEGVEGWKKDDCELTVIMPCLSSLGIHACSKLKTLPHFLFKRPLQNLDISGSMTLSDRYKL